MKKITATKRTVVQKAIRKAIHKPMKRAVKTHMLTMRTTSAEHKRIHKLAKALDLSAGMMILFLVDTATAALQDKKH